MNGDDNSWRWGPSTYMVMMIHASFYYHGGNDYDYDPYIEGVRVELFRSSPSVVLVYRPMVYGIGDLMMID